MRRTPPKRIYLERWPESAFRDDAIHYSPTGYGDDMRGNTSCIYMYERVKQERPSRQRKGKRK